MKQQTLAMAADQTFENYPTRRDGFVNTMEAIVPGVALCEVIEPHYPKTGNVRPPIYLERMVHEISHRCVYRRTPPLQRGDELRIEYLQNSRAHRGGLTQLA